MKKVEIVKQAVIFDDVFRIEEALLRFQRFDGTMSDSVRRLNFEREDSVAAIIFNEDTNKVLLVNQFKYPTYGKGPGWITEIVAGILDNDEDPESAIKREILEETGFRTSRLTPISTFYVSPGGSSERIFLYYATVSNADKIARGGGLSSEDEDILTLEMTLPELWKSIDSGDIVDAKTIIATSWLRARKEEK